MSVATMQGGTLPMPPDLRGGNHLIERGGRAQVRPECRGTGSPGLLSHPNVGMTFGRHELIKPRTPWRTIEDLEVSTAAWVHWLNHHRLYEYCGEIPPIELETAYNAQQRRPAAG